MNTFYKSQSKIVFMVVLALLFQIVWPVVGDYAYAEPEVNKSFVMNEGEIGENDEVEIKWSFELRSDEEVGIYTHEGNFNLENEIIEKSFESNDGTEIGVYSVSTEGLISVKIYDELYDVFEEPEEPKDEEGPEEPKDEEEPEEPKDEEGPEEPKDEEGPEEPKDEEELEEPKDEEEPEEPKNEEVTLIGKSLGVGASINKKALSLEEESTEVEKDSDQKDTPVIEDELENDLDNDKSHESNDTDKQDEEEKIEIQRDYSGTITIENVIPLNGTDPVTWDDVKIVDSEGKETTGPFKRNDDVTIRFEYSIVDKKEVNTDKVYNFTIPEEIEIIKELNISLKDKDGRILGNTIVEPGGAMTFQFLPEINNEEFMYDRDGWITINSKFDETKLGDGGSEEIIFNYNGNSKNITVEFPKIEEKANVVLEKSGDYDDETNEITWTVKVKPTTEPAGRTIKNINIIDEIQSGQTYITGSAKLNNKEMSDPVNGSTLNYTFVELKDGDDQTITFKTKIDPSNFTKDGVENGDVLIFKNAVGGTFGEGEDKKDIEEVKDSVIKTVNFIEKDGDQVTGEDKGEGKVKWTIKVNPDNLELPAGVVIEDILGDRHKFNKDLEVNGGPYGKYGTMIAESDTGFTFKFDNAITEQHLLTFTTTATDDVYQGNTSNYKNEAKISWGGNDRGSSGEIGVDVTSNVIRKSGAGYDRSTRQVTWMIKVNGNRNTITNPTITDELPEQLEYVSHTITGGKTWGFTIDNNKLTFSLGEDEEINEEYTITLITKIKDGYEKYFGDNHKGKTIKNTAEITGGGVKRTSDEGTQNIISQVIKKSPQGYDYKTRTAKWKIIVNQNKMKIDKAVVTDNLGEFHKLVDGTLKVDDKDFTGYTVDGNVITINLGTIDKEQKTITFETQIPEGKVKEFFEKNGPTKLVNKSTIEGEQINGKVESNTEQPVKNTVVSKKGKYERGNDFIDWEVVINSNELDLEAVKLTDELQEGLIFDSESVTLNEMTLQSDGSLVEGSERNVDINYDSETRTATFDIGNIKNAYILRFRTDIEDDYNRATFNNSIKLTGSNGDETGTSTAIGVSFQTGDAGGGAGTRGSLTVKKIDNSDSTKVTPLEGAKFELYKSDQTTLVATSELTEADGEVLFDDLRMGKYYIREIQAPEGYVLDSNLKEIELKKSLDSKYVTYEFLNKRIKANIKLFKIDQDENPLTGAVFGLFNTEDTEFENPIYTETSDTEGLVEFKGVEYGKYLVKEISAPLGYVPSDEVLDVNISGNDATVELESVINRKVIGSIKFVKKDNEGNLLPGVEFKLYDELDIDFENSIDTATSNDEGLVEFENIAYGKYLIKETNAPKEYIPFEGTLEVEIKENNEVVELEDVINTIIKGTIKFIKKDSEENRLEGVEFGLYSKDDKEFENPIQTRTSVNEGKVEFKDIAYGDYIVKEISAPEGYIASDIELEVKVREENHGRAIILEDVENTRIRGNIEIDKVDESKEPLEGATFGLYKVPYETNDEPFATTVSDGNGKVRFEKVPYGEYEIREITAPDSYEPSYEVIPVFIEVHETTVYPSKGAIVNEKIIGDVLVTKFGEKDTTVLEGAIFVLEQDGMEKYRGTTDEKGRYVFKDIVHGEYILKEIQPPIGYNPTDKTKEIVISEYDQKPIIADYSNTKIRGNIEFTKYGENEDVLEGAEFTLYKDTDEGFEEPVLTATSDSNGIVLFEEVEYGKYVIVETKAPEGHNLSDVELEVEILEEGKTITLDSIDNTKIRGNVEILKIDKRTKRPLRNATIAIFTQDGRFIDEDFTDTEGKVRFEDLVYGKYFFKETKAPLGYILNEEQYPFEISENEVTKEFVLENTRIPDEVPEDKGRIRLIKKDKETGELLPDVEFEVRNSKGELVDTLVVNYSGKAVSKYLPFGEYTIKETIAPEGYVLDETVHEITLVDNNDDNNDLEIVVYNEKDDSEDPKPEKIEIPVEKVWDGKTEEDVTIELMANTKKIDEVKLSDINDWKHIFDNLDKFDEEGKEIEYTIKEIEIKGYESVITGNIEDGFTVTNTEDPKDPPKPTDPEDPDPEDPKDPPKPTDPEDPDPEDPKDPPKPTDPEDPDPEDPKDPPKPTDPEDPDPEDPKDPPKPTDPDTPDPTDPTDPKDPETPDPTDPTKPKEDDEDDDPLIDLDGDTPSGGTDVDVPPVDIDGNVPTGGREVDQPILPKTGEASNMIFYFTGLVLIALGFVFRRKRA